MQICPRTNAIWRFNSLNADLGKEQLARKLARRPLIGDDEDRHAWLFSRPNERPEAPRYNVGRGKGFGEKADADA